MTWNEKIKEWLVEEESLSTIDGKPIKVFSFNYDSNDRETMSAWAKHFRTIKITFYKKVQYIEKIARKNNVRVIYFIGENYYYPIEKIKEIQKAYNQRIKHASITLLSLNMISKKYEHIMTISFDTKNIECETYAINQINKPYANKNCSWLTPILSAIKNLQSNS